MLSQKLRQNEWINALTWVCKGNCACSKIPKVLPTKRTTVGLFVFPLFSFGQAWFKRGSLDPRKSKSENSNMFLYAVWRVACALCEIRETRTCNFFFPKKEAKVVLGKERVVIAMWTPIQKIRRDPKPQNWGWIPDGNPPLCPSSAHPWV